MRRVLPVLLLLVALVAAPGANAQEAPAPDAASVAATLTEMGPPVGDVRLFDAETDPNRLLGRPGQYIGKVSWRDERAPDSNATLEFFADEPALRARERYTEAISRAGGPFTQYIYANPSRLALLRLPFALTPEQAAEYDAWLQAL
jgi:hypothetical protein